MVITIICDKWDIKRILVGQGSYAGIMYCEAFERHRINLEDLKPFKVSLIGFCGDQVQVKGYTMMKIMFGEQDQAK